MAAHVMEGTCETYTDERWAGNVHCCKKNHKKSLQVAKKNNKLSKGTEARSRVASYARPSASSQPISCCSIFISLYTFHRVSSTFI